MNWKIIIVLALIVSAIFISGCTVQPIASCGNNACDLGETFENCPQDCGAANIPMPQNTGAEGGQPPLMPF